MSAISSPPSIFATSPSSPDFDPSALDFFDFGNTRWDGPKCGLSLYVPPDINEALSPLFNTPSSLGSSIEDFYSPADSFVSLFDDSRPHSPLLLPDVAPAFLSDDTNDIFGLKASSLDSTIPITISPGDLISLLTPAEPSSVSTDLTENNVQELGSDDDQSGDYLGIPSPTKHLKRQRSLISTASSSSRWPQSSVTENAPPSDDEEIEECPAKRARTETTRIQKPRRSTSPKAEAHGEAKDRNVKCLSEEEFEEYKLQVEKLTRSDRMHCPVHSICQTKPQPMTPADWLRHLKTHVLLEKKIQCGLGCGKVLSRDDARLRHERESCRLNKRRSKKLK